MEELLAKPVIAAPSLTVLDFDECQRNDLNEYLTRYCGFVRAIKKTADPDGSKISKSAPISVKILTRSPDEVLGYLGRVAGFSSEHNMSIPVPEYSVVAQEVWGLIRAPCLVAIS